MSEVIATLGSNALVLDGAEETLGKEAALTEARVQQLEIVTEEDYGFAAEYARYVKQMQKKVTDYWEPMRVSAKKNYDIILAHKKEMMTPLESAEKSLKKKMAGYLEEQERKRREREEAMRKLAQAEVERKLTEAAEAESAGDAVTAEYAMAEAEVMDNVASNGSVAAAAPKAEGTSAARTWEIKSIDGSKVPVEIAGVVIRPVDEKAVMRLIKASKGSIQIPGVVYEGTFSISVRS